MVVSDDPSNAGQAALKRAALGAVRLSLRDHALLALFCLVYLAVVVSVLAAYDRPTNFFRYYVIEALSPLVLAVAFLCFGHVLTHLVHVRPLRVRALLASIVDDERLALPRVVYLALPVLLFPLVRSVFTLFKAAIPALHPYSWDRTWMAVDRWLHFGHDPWALLHPVLGYPLVTSVISYLYGLWIAVTYVIVYWQIFSVKNPALRMRYLLSFVALWAFLGSGMAVAFASVGPCFFDPILGEPGAYGELMAYLRAANDVFPNFALPIQDHLLESYQSGRSDFADGISAMPSLHVAIVVLEALWGWQVNRRLGVVLTLYAGLVMVGSVHLGWHYAVDGYVSALGAVVVWWGAGKVVRWWPPRFGTVAPVWPASAPQPVAAYGAGSRPGSA